MPQHIPILPRDPLAFLYGSLKAVCYHIKAGTVSCAVKQIIPCTSIILANCKVLYFPVIALDRSKIPRIRELYYIRVV